MPFDGTLEDRLLIRERMPDYADAMFQQDLGAWLANFTEDCVWRGVGLEYRGLDELAASWPTWRACRCGTGRAPFAPLIESCGVAGL